MTSPAIVIREEMHTLIQHQIEAFRRPWPLTSDELREYHDRAEKIKQLGQELNRVTAMSVLERHFGKAS
jgi:hypothetical protein